MKTDHTAKLVIHELDKMDKRQIVKLVKWLDEIGPQIISDPKAYTKTATWRLMK